jgi:hypothetical protein
VAVERTNAQPASEPERSPARPASAMPSLGRGLNPATALALQRTAGNRALVQALQRYAEKSYTRTTWRQADDLSTATRTGYPNHELWAKPGKAAQSNTALQAVKSDIELVETAKEDTFFNDDKSIIVKLRKVEARNKVNGTQGDGMLLWADCGRSASVVVGSLNRQAVFKDGGNRAVATGSPDQMKAGIMKNWLPREKQRKLFVESNQADADLIQDALDTGAKREAELKPIAARLAKAKSKLQRDAITAEYWAKMGEMAEAYLAYYNSRSDKERKEIDRDLGINWFARPTVGQGYTTSSGGAAVPGAGDTWNFHWSGVVMQSDDGRDNVVIENYSVSDWDKENDKWTFETYGTRYASQTFHGQHQATGQHGQTPTTMVIETKP